MMIEDAKVGGALGSNIWALRGRFGVSVEVLVLLVLPLVTLEAEALEALVTGFKSPPVNMFEARETFGGKLGGIGVESVMVESLLECCCLLVSSVKNSYKKSSINIHKHTYKHEILA